MAAVAIAEGSAHPSVNALLTAIHEGAATGEVERYARRLMAYASSPERLDAAGIPLISYDRYEGIHSYNTALRVLREAGAK